MNWVGGSRTRVLIKQERRKQKEYFERNRLKSKMKLLGVLSPVKNSTASLDLLNLYMVNQISCKKKAPETVKKPIHVNMNRDIKMPLRQFELELPMSPHCIPSKLCLDDTENNNMHYQKPGNKEGCGPIQSSQVMGSYSMFEPQFGRTENCSCFPPPFSTELSSDGHVPKQSFPPRVVPSPRKVAFGKKQNEQLNNVYSSDSLVSKLNECQDILSSPYEIAKFGSLFERLNNPGNGDFLTTRPGEDCSSINERRESNFIIEDQPLQRIWGENGKEISNFLKDVNQPTHSIFSENCDSFVDQNMINLLSVDQQMIQKTFDTCGYDNLGNACLVTNYDENNSTSGCMKSIFTVPKSTSNDSTFNKTNCPEKCQPIKNYQKAHNSSEIYDLSTSFVDCYPASYEKQGKQENDYQEKTPQKNIQENPVNSVCNSPSGELHPNQSWDFGLGEILVEEGTGSLKGRPTSTKKIYLDSSQSSQCTSYSPRPTDSCFSSSSEMPSEDEEQILKQTEDSNKMSTQTTETSNNFYLEKVAELSDNRIVKQSTKLHKQNENFYQYSVKNNIGQFPQSQCNSVDALKNKSNNYILQVVKCEAGVQTEREPVMGEKSDATTQCDILPRCACGRDMSSLRDIVSCTESLTTGGQETLTNN